MQGVKKVICIRLEHIHLRKVAKITEVSAAIMFDIK